MEQWVQGLLAGSRRAVARLLTLVEDEAPEKNAVMAALFPHTGRAAIIGITGAPGTGKSSLVNALAKAFREQDKTVGIIAVDPTSPFSGGAILGDRIRMRDLSGDAGVFIRSMATRGSLGGLARSTRDAVRVLDAAGFDVVLIETVGAGQSEVDIVRTAQTTIVVEAPGLGDDVQAIKAGILEIADILVVNKADHPGAQNTVRVLRAMLELGHSQNIRHHGQFKQVNGAASQDDKLWMPRIIQTVAVDNQGIDDLLRAVEAHQAFIHQQGIMDEYERARMRLELYERLQATITQQIMAGMDEQQLTMLLNRIANREIDPQTAVFEILKMREMP